MNRTLSGTTTPGRSGSGSNGNKGIFRIPQNSSITGASPSNCFVPYPGYWLVGVLPLCRYAANVFYSTSRLGQVYANSDKTDGTNASFNCNSLELVDQLIYLGSNISFTESNVNISIRKAWTAIDRLLII